MQLSGTTLHIVHGTVQSLQYSQLKHVHLLFIVYEWNYKPAGECTPFVIFDEFCTRNRGGKLSHNASKITSFQQI